MPPATSGSSPLTRGALVRQALSRPPVGIIPAHAGSTLPRQPVVQAVPDHPRSRGEHGLPDTVQWTAKGSSPLTRGALLRSRHHPSKLGIIPAHAGSTLVGWRWRRSWMDHPRSRGEHLMARIRTIKPEGSSPLTRGALGFTSGAFVHLGIIPAHAGSTGAASAPTESTTDHPRSRGEHRGDMRYKISTLGSSPLTRGAPPSAACLATFTGIIPAHAGSTTFDPERGKRCGDHPRSRGEHRT